MMRFAALALATMAAVANAQGQSKVSTVTVCATHRDQGLPSQFVPIPNLNVGGTTPATQIIRASTFSAKGNAFVGPVFDGPCPVGAPPAGANIGYFASICDPDPFQVVDVTYQCGGPGNAQPVCPGTAAGAGALGTFITTPADVKAFCEDAARAPLPVFPAGGAFCSGFLGLRGPFKYAGHTVDFSYRANPVNYANSGGFAYAVAVQGAGAAPPTPLLGFVTCHFVPTITTTVDKIVATTGKYWKVLTTIASIAITTRIATTLPTTGNFGASGVSSTVLVGTPANSAAARAQLATDLFNLQTAFADNFPLIIDWNQQITITYKKWGKGTTYL